MAEISAMALKSQRGNENTSQARMTAGTLLSSKSDLQQATLATFVKLIHWWHCSVLQTCV